LSHFCLRHTTEAEAAEEIQRRKLENIEFILARLSKSIENASPETKRLVIESLLLEIRVSKDSEGNPALRIVFVFEESNPLPECYNDIDYGKKSPQLHFSRMSVRNAITKLELKVKLMRVGNRLQVVTGGNKQRGWHS
jgi:hypothetical protein